MQITKKTCPNRAASLLSATVLFVFAKIAVGQTSTAYVDFGPSSSRTASPDSNGRVWNNITETNATSFNALLNDAGQPTGVVLQCGGTILVNPFGTTLPNASTLGGLAIPSATQDWFYVGPSPDSLTVTLSNLAIDGIYRLSLFGSRDSSDTRITRYDVFASQNFSTTLTTGAAGIGMTPQLNANRSNLAVFNNLSPDASGRITITVRVHTGPFAYLGALRLETMNAVNAPPAAYEVKSFGSGKVGASLNGFYKYQDPENDAESGSQLSWEVANTNALNVVATTIPNTSQGILNVDSSLVGKYVRFCANARSVNGRSQGLASKSAWIGPILGSETLTSFHIGSSFSEWINVPYQLSDLSNASGILTRTGCQLTSGRDSSYHWTAGLGGANYTYGRGTSSRLEIPTRSWDVVVLQPFNTEWEYANRAQMADYAGRFYRLADESGSRFYLYCYWPKRADPLSTQDQINVVFEQVRSSIGLGGVKPPLIIPVGEVFRAVAQQMGTGDLAGYNRDALYLSGDDRHASHLGGYISALTHYATVHRVSPVGLPARTVDAAPSVDSLVSIPPAVALRVQQIVWDVVSVYPNALSQNTSFSNPPLTPTTPTSPPPVVWPPVVTEPDPPFVTESATPSDPGLLSHAFGAVAQGSTTVHANLPKPVFEQAAGQFVAEYTLNPVAESEGVVYTPHWSYDLKNWTATQPASTVINRTDNTVRISWPNGSRWRFLRIHVAKPAQ